MVSVKVYECLWEDNLLIIVYLVYLGTVYSNDT